MDERLAVRRGKGGRRALPEDQRRSIRKEVWLSSVELADLKARASAHGVTPGEYMRLAITQAPLPKPPVPSVNLAAWRELARLAANANQYQLAINQRVARSWPADLIPELLEALHEVRLSLLGISDGNDDGEPDDD